jgi:copper chaperone CopZ
VRNANEVLKKQLRKCEQERLEIIEQLEQMEGDRQVTMVTKTGTKIELRSQEMNYRDMRDYKQAVKADIIRLEQHLNHMQGL